MAVTKAKKAEQIEKLNQDLQKASSMIVGTFSKLTVSKDFELRKTVRTAGGRYQVVKNTLAKRLSKYVDDNPEFSFKSGVLEGRVISMKEIKALATMPSKEELYSKLLFLINAPAQRLVTVMNAVGRDLAVVVSQGVEKGKFKDAGDGAAAEAAPAEAAP